MTVRYRAYDNKGRYQQSYSAEFPDAFSWAIQCASQTKGSVKEVNDLGDEKEVWTYKPQP